MNPFSLHADRKGRHRPASVTGITLETIRELLLREGRWVLWLALTGLLLGLAYASLRQPKYRISTTLLVGNGNQTTEKLQNAFSRTESDPRQPVLNDQVVMLKSYRLTLTTLEDISHGYRMYRKSPWKKTDLYPDEPFAITTNIDSADIRNAEISVTVIDQNSFRMNASGFIRNTNREVAFNIDTVARFGQTLITPFLKLTMTPNEGVQPILGSVYEINFPDKTSLTRDYLERLNASTTPTRESGSRITLEFETSDLIRDTDYLNRLVENFIQTETIDAGLATDKAIELIDRQLTEVRESLSASGNLVSEFRSKTQTISPENEAANAFNIKGQLENRRTEIRMELDFLQQMSTYLAETSTADAPALPASGVLSDNALMARITRLNELYNRRKVLSFSAEERSPVMQALSQEITFLHQGLRESITGATARASRELSAISERLGQLNGRLASLPRTENTLNGIRRGYDIKNELYDFLLGKRAEAEIAKAASRSAIRIVDPAAAETATLISPIPPINIALGLLAGAFAGILLISVKGILSDVIFDDSEISNTLRAQPTGIITYNNRKEETVVISSPGSATAESFRGMRININHVLGNTSSHILAVQAFHPEAGKSFVALNLALLNAELGRRTLLIDADLRKPGLHTALKMPLLAGLNNYTSGTFRARELIQPSSYPFLDFMSAGTSSIKTARLPDPDQLTGLMTELRKSYEWIIIDNSPYHILQDARILGSLADGNLFLFRIGMSTRKELDELAAVAEAGYLKNIMVAVNGRRINQKRGYGYYTD